MSQPARQVSGSAPAEPVPVAFLGRTSTLLLQDPAASLRRQAREVQAKLPPGWFIAAWFWDIESGGLDLEQRGHGTAHQAVNVGLPRDGGLAALLAEAAPSTPGTWSTAAAAPPAAAASTPCPKTSGSGPPNPPTP